MKVLRIVAIVAAVLVLGLAAIGIFAPGKYDVKRETIINAPIGTVFFTATRFSEFPKWSPWQELDPNMKVTLEGTDGTVGAKYSWEGNDKAGSGSMTITAIEANKSLTQDLHFVKPFESSSNTYMNFEETDGGVKVVWGMRGESDFVSKIFCTFMGGMDGMVGKDYEKGLTKLKELCESGPVYAVNEIDWAEKNCLSKREVLKFENMPAFFGQHYPAMYTEIAKATAEPGIPLAVYYDYDEAKGQCDVAAAVPFAGKPVSSKNYAALNLPAGKAYQIDYYGPYNEQMKKPYEAMDAKLKELGKTNPDMVIEEYISDPMAEPDSTKWYTKIYFFVK